MNPHRTKTTKTSTTLIGLALAAAIGAALGCSDSGGSPTGTGGSGTGTAGTTGSGGRGGTTGTGGGTAGTGGTGTGGSATGTGGSATAGTGGSTAGTGGSTAGTGGSTAGTGGSTAGTGGGTAGTGGSATGGSGGGGTGGGGGITGPVNLPPTLNPPAGATLKLRLHATGDQIYTCTASTGGAGGGAGGAGGSGATTYAYVLKQPDAKLFDASNTQVGTHGLGPNWTSTVDNSVVNGARAAQENSPLTDAIPWLLLRATSNTGTGVFSDITYVIRANTTGGKAPATGCDAATAGTDTKIAYTADYFFYNGGGPGTAWNTPPGNLPAAIAVPSGATFKLHDHAIGVQIYTCTASTGGAGGGGGAGGAGGSGATTYAWVLKQPDAVLYDSSFAQVGTHGLGPNWTSTVDASVVVGTRVNGSNVTGTIAWLLLSATSNTGTGVFSDVTYIQRLNTAGGVAPGGCDATTAGTDTSIKYSADYYFFTGGVTVDGGTGG